MNDPDLRRKHIETLEILQTLSDENEELKRRVNNTKPGETLETAENNDRMLDMLTELRQEVNGLEASLAEEKKRNEDGKVNMKKEVDMFKDKYRNERDQSKKIMKEMEAQGVLMENLRNELDKLSAEAEKNSEPPNSVEPEKIVEIKEVIVEVEKIVVEEKIVERIVEKVVENKAKIEGEHLTLVLWGKGVERSNNTRSTRGAERSD